MLKSPCRFEFIRTRYVSRQLMHRAKSVLTGSGFFCGFGFNRKILSSLKGCCPNEFESTALGVRACR